MSIRKQIRGSSRLFKTCFEQKSQSANMNIKPSKEKEILAKPQNWTTKSTKDTHIILVSPSN
uniref:Putative ovule protein n=1 Tax=Solanum chacoense TaxID=4108 RepID=A0A0V0IC80_SOLCH